MLRLQTHITRCTAEIHTTVQNSNKIHPKFCLNITNIKSKKYWDLDYFEGVYENVSNLDVISKISYFIEIY